MDMQQYLKDLEYLVNIDSGSKDGFAGLDKIADFFRERFEALGWQTEKHDLSPDAGPCLICTNRKAEKYDLLMIGHIDTVFPLGTAAERPFRYDDTYAYGPGASDMKDGSLLMYYIIKELPAELAEKLNIVVVFNPDEEIGSIYSRNAYKSYAERTRYAFVYEGSSATGVSCAERKGGIVYTVRFKGVAGHCGYVLTNGAKSAVHEMGRWIVALADMQDEAIGTSVNVGIANGGITKNTVAPDAMMVVDIRIKDNDEPDRFEAAIARLTEAAEKRGIGVEIERRFKPALVYTDEVRAYVEHVCEITKAAGIPFSHAPRGGLSDANIIASYGAICLDGLGPSSGGGSHSPDEKSQYKTAEHFKNLSLFLMKDIAENK
jgi:glutamate carboxypeptidase